MRVAAYLPFLRKRPHARYRELEARIMIDFLMSILCTPIRSHTDKTSNLKFFDRGAAATLVIEIWLAGKLVWHARKTILDIWHERSHHSVTHDQLLCEASFLSWQQHLQQRARGLYLSRKSEDEGPAAGTAAANNSSPPITAAAAKVTVINCIML